MSSYPELYKSAVLEAVGLLDLAKIQEAVEWFTEARGKDRMIFVCGNGGSAATASHFCCDMMKCASSADLGRFRIVSLVDTVPTVTAYANDEAYSKVFARQLEHLASPDDLFVAISGSGNSPNVVEAMEAATRLGLRTIAMTGRNGGKLGPMAQLQIHVPVPHMGRIEDSHMIACHMICYHFVDHEKHS